MWRVLAGLAVIFSVSVSWAQTGARDPYAGEPIVVERFNTAFRYNADGTGSKVDTEVVRVQTEAGVRGVGIVTVPYFAARERVELVYLRVRKRSGAVIDTPAADAEDQVPPVTRVDPQYSSLHAMRIGVRGLGVGDRLEMQVRTVFLTGQAGGEFWGSETLGRGPVTLERGVELRVPVSRHVLVSSPGHPAQVNDEGAEQVYSWQGSQLAATVAKRGATDLVGPQAGAGGERPAIAWTSFASWAAVGAWYRTCAGPDGPDPAVKAKADEVVYGAKTPGARSLALYQFVSSKVRTIDVRIGTGSYGWRAPGQVLANLYGDSQDKAALLTAMLRAEGLPAAVALVSDGVDADEAVPSPTWFSRAVVVTHDATGAEVWLDPAPEVAPYRLLERPLRNRLALVVSATGQPVLARTPADAPFAEFTRTQVRGQLSDTGALTAHVDVTLRGGEEVLYRQALRDAGPAQWDRVSAYLASRAGLPGQPGATTVDTGDKDGEALHLGYDLTGEHLADWENFRLVPLLPRLDLPLTDRKTAPASAIELSKRTDNAEFQLVLPEGFGADLPAEFLEQTPFATLKTTYRLAKDGRSQVLTVERTLQVTADTVPANEWPAYRSFLDQAAKSNPVLQLTSLTAHRGPGHFPPAAGENNPRAAALVEEANQAAAGRNWDEAMARLDEAKAILPRQPFLWSGYGTVALGKGDPATAVEDLRRELQEHPEEIGVSHRLALLLEQRGDRTAAVAVLQAALERDPEDGSGARLLANILAGSNLAAAEGVLRKALLLLPGNLGLELALGDVLLQAGKRDEGVKLLAAVAGGSTDPGQLNDSAYALASAGAGLKVAEGAARQALQLLNAALARGVTGVGSIQDLQRSEALVSVWDTYGWVLYQEGSYSEAEPWLHAAWADSHSLAAGTHYGRLLQKQGRPAEASRVLAAAAHADRETGAEDAEGAMARRQPAKTTRTGGHAPGVSPDASSGRVFRLPGVTDVSRGSALFEMDFWLGGPTVARFVSGDEQMQELADAVARVDTGTVLPPGSVAHLLRRGVVTCGDGGTCSLRLLPLRQAVAP